MPSREQRVAVVDLLRGIAALAVAYGHLTGAAAGWLDGEVVASGRRGGSGVAVFFVISGFVIPYALAAAGYRFADYPRFLLKRVVRLHPTYTAALVATVALAYFAAVTPGSRGTAPTFSGAALAAHLAYLNGVLDLAWVNSAYWTLAIEMQLYLLLGLVYPLLAGPRRGLAAALVLAFAAAGTLSADVDLMLPWSPLFAAGMAAFLVRTHRLSWRAGITLLTAVTALSGYVLGAWMTAVGAGTALCIVAVRGEIGPTAAFLGRVSYPLYLLHHPIGARVMGLATRLPAHPVVQVGALLAALGASLAAAYGLHRAVEAPSLRWSARIRYRQRGMAARTTPSALDER